MASGRGQSACRATTPRWKLPLVSRQLLKSGCKLREYLFDLPDARTLAEQRALYEKIEPALWGRFSTWLLRQPTALAMLGVPRPQIRLIQ